MILTGATDARIERFNVYDTRAGRSRGAPSNPIVREHTSRLPRHEVSGYLFQLIERRWLFMNMTPVVRTRMNIW